MNEFKKLKINDIFIKKLDARKITKPTVIQEQVIPKILNGKDVIAQSKTGTGKTIAFLIPLLQLTLSKKSPVLIIAPTNELARQLSKEVDYFTNETDISAIHLPGGVPIEQQIQELKKDYTIIVSVPGRVLKLVTQGALKLSRIKKMVLDEADFLIDLGFLSDLKKIFSYAKNINQLCIFSATLSNKTKKILDIMHNQKISTRVDATNKLPDTIENYFFPTTDEERETELFKILNTISPFLCIIFVRTKDICKYLYTKLRENNYSVTYINGDLRPSQRKRAIKEFKEAKVQYMVATDLAGRGLDVESITHIINYNLPVNELDYLHRAGRTGRMHDNGLVYSLCNELDEGYLKKYAEILNFQLTPVHIKGGAIEINKKYKGVKPRFNLAELKKQEKIKQKEKEKNGGKKNRRKKRR